MDILLIAGMWLTAPVWQETADHLTRQGHRAVPIRLPGQDDGDVAATLADQVAAVLGEVDRAARPLVVGHSAASGLAWLVADARPDAIAGVAMVGGFPPADGATYFDAFPARNGVVPFPGWERFDGPDTADLDGASRTRLESLTVPVPSGVTGATVRLRDERRHRVPVTLVCPEYSPDEARSWIEAGHLPELARAEDVRYADLATGHWPMISAPDRLAAAIAGIAERA